MNLEKLPRTLTVVGAGVIGCEYASIFAALGVRVTLIDKRHAAAAVRGREITDALAYHLRENRVTLRLGEEVSAIEPIDDRARRAGEDPAGQRQADRDRARRCTASAAAARPTTLNLAAAGLHGGRVAAG